MPRYFIRKAVISIFLALVCILPVVSYAVLADKTEVPAVTDLKLLSDEALIETYIDTMAEMETSKAFHTTSGFTPKEYKKYKDLVKYRLQLLFEIDRRKISLPPSLN
jgi:hypothetical protein